MSGEKSSLCQSIKRTLPKCWIVSCAVVSTAVCIGASVESLGTFHYFSAIIWYCVKSWFVDLLSWESWTSPVALAVVATTTCRYIFRVLIDYHEKNKGGGGVTCLSALGGCGDKVSKSCNCSCRIFRYVIPLLLIFLATSTALDWGYEKTIYSYFSGAGNTVWTTFSSEEGRTQTWNAVTGAITETGQVCSGKKVELESTAWGVAKDCWFHVTEFRPYQAWLTWGRGLNSAATDLENHLSASTHLPVDVFKDGKSVSLPVGEIWIPGIDPIRRFLSFGLFVRFFHNIAENTKDIFLFFWPDSAPSDSDGNASTNPITKCWHTVCKGWHMFVNVVSLGCATYLAADHYWLSTPEGEPEREPTDGETTDQEVPPDTQQDTPSETGKEQEKPEPAERAPQEPEPEPQEPEPECAIRPTTYNECSEWYHAPENRCRERYTQIAQLCGEEPKPEPPQPDITDQDVISEASDTPDINLTVLSDDEGLIKVSVSRTKTLVAGGVVLGVVSVFYAFKWWALPWLRKYFCAAKVEAEPTPESEAATPGKDEPEGDQVTTDSADSKPNPEPSAGSGTPGTSPQLLPEGNTAEAPAPHDAVLAAAAQVPNQETDAEPNSGDAGDNWDTIILGGMGVAIAAVIIALLVVCKKAGDSDAAYSEKLPWYGSPQRYDQFDREHADVYEGVQRQKRASFYDELVRV